MKKVWVESYRPRSIKQVIFTDTLAEKAFASYVAEGTIPNLLLHGPQGTGKTSVSKALVRDLQLDPSDVLRINCSDEKIDAMRDKVKTFATTMALGKFKVVQLEEFDYLGHDAQALLRGLIEDTSGSCRYIATCNYINKVTPPLRSRFQEYAFKAPSRDDVVVRGAEILEAEGIEFDVDDLERVVAAAYPDVRKVIQLLEAGSLSGALRLTESEVASDWKIALLPLLEVGDFKASRKLVCESATKEELLDVYRFLYDNLSRMKLKQKDEALVLLAQYQYQHAFVADAEINIAAMFVEMGGLN